jgi:hypothetical protein
VCQQTNQPASQIFLTSLWQNVAINQTYWASGKVKIGGHILKFPVPTHMLTVVYIRFLQHYIIMVEGTPKEIL